MILRAVFGLDAGARLDRLRVLLAQILELSGRPMSMLPFLQRELGGRTPWGRFVRLRAEADQLIHDLIEERRGSHDADRDDVLSMLLDARHEDGSPMSEQELRDELMTLLVAGHETTASQLGWLFECLAREPRVVERLRAEIAAGEDDAYVTATVQEALRRYPVLPNAAPRLVKQPIEVGGWNYPPGVCLIANAYLIHHDPDIYRGPLRVPARALRRQAAGHLHLDPVRRRAPALPRRELRDARDEDRAAAAIERVDVRPGYDGPVLSKRRAITLSPRSRATTMLYRRAPATVNGSVAESAAEKAVAQTHS